MSNTKYEVWGAYGITDEGLQHRAVSLALVAVCKTLEQAFDVTRQMIAQRSENANYIPAWELPLPMIRQRGDDLKMPGFE